MTQGKVISEGQAKRVRCGVLLVRLAKKILRIRARVRDGTPAWVTFQKRMAPLMKQVDSLLEEGALARRANAGPGMWSVYSRCARPAASRVARATCRGEALLRICVMPVVVI